MPTKQEVRHDTGLQALAEAEKLLRHLANYDDPSTYALRVSPADAIKLRVCGVPIDSPRETRRLFGRIYVEHELAETAGSEAEFAAAKEAAASASKAYASKRDALQATIREAQEKLAALENGQQAAQGKLDAMTTARERLTSEKQLPLFVAARIKALEQLASECGGPERQRLLAERDQCLQAYVAAVTDDTCCWLDGDLSDWTREVV